MFFFLSPRPAQTTIETRKESLSTMPHALLVSPCAAATARRLSAITASTLGRSSQAAPASAFGLSPQRPRSERFDAAATSTNAAICRLHQPHRRLLPPPRAVKKTYTSFDDMIKEVRTNNALSSAPPRTNKSLFSAPRQGGAEERAFWSEKLMKDVLDLLTFFSFPRNPISVPGPGFGGLPCQLVRAVQAHGRKRQGARWVDVCELLFLFRERERERERGRKKAKVFFLGQFCPSPRSHLLTRPASQKHNHANQSCNRTAPTAWEETSR